MKKSIMIKLSFFIIIGLMLGGCVFNVTSPKPSGVDASLSDFKRLPTDQLQMTIVFSEATDAASIVVGKTLILKFSQNANADATLEFTDPKTMLITTTKTVNELMSFQPDDGWCLTLVGNDKGSGVVKDSSGKILDGDYDSKEGGDYIMCYRIIG